MDSLLQFYPKKFAKFEGNIFELFTKFYSLDLSPIDSWLECQFKNKIRKDNNKAEYYLSKGKSYVTAKDYLKCLECYSKCISAVTTDNEQLYSLALDHRSQALYKLQEYEDCLKDIDLCLKKGCPLPPSLNLYLRKAKCFLRTGQKQYMFDTIKEGLDFLETDSGTTNRECYIQEFSELKILNVDDSTSPNPKSVNVLPDFDVGENTNFAYASSKIKLSYDKERGRHVTAQKPIYKGDVLFVEKALAIAPVFTENKDINLFKCNSCLKDMISSVPCRSCTLCLYCSETCRETSWEDCHKWECEGMQAGIWYHLGIAFPGFRTLMKGVKSGFCVIKGGYEEDLKNFGDKNNNYPYFSRLMSHVYKNKNAAPYLLMAAVVVRYLIRYTDFFPWLLKQENRPKDDLNELIHYVGGLLTKHIAQLACNSSVIEHCSSVQADKLSPGGVISVACGIFPSVSLMNHSCKANITNSFICDTIVVRAAEDIAIDEEIFNCYGIDYRIMDRRQRQQACRNLYFFECKCIICSDPLKNV